MRTRSLLILAAVALVLVAATFALTRQDRARTAFSRADERPFAQLPEQAPALRQVRLTGAGGTVHLDLTDGRWTVREKHAYPADTARLSELLAGLAGLRLIEPRTDDPARHGALDLTDPDSPGSRALLIEVLGAEPEPVAALVLGKPRTVKGGNTRQRYVRLPGQARTWLAETSADPPRDPSLWLARQVLDIPAGSIRRIEVALAGQAPYTLARAQPEADFTLDPLPAGRTLDAQRAGTAAFALQDLTLQNVFTSDEVTADWAGADRATFTTDTGLVVELTVAQVNGVPNARVAVRAPDGANPDAIAQAQALSARTRGWVYVLAPHPVSTFMRPADALLVPPPGAEPPAGGPPPGPARRPLPPFPGGGA